MPQENVTSGCLTPVITFFFRKNEKGRGDGGKHHHSKEALVNLLRVRSLVFVNIFSAWCAANKNIQRANWCRIYCCWRFSSTKPVTTERPLDVQAQFLLVKEIRVPLGGWVSSSQRRTQPQNTQANGITGLSLPYAPHVPVGCSRQALSSIASSAHQAPTQAQQGLVPPLRIQAVLSALQDAASYLTGAA